MLKFDLDVTDEKRVVVRIDNEGKLTMKPMAETHIDANTERIHRQAEAAIEELINEPALISLCESDVSHIAAGKCVKGIYSATASGDNRETAALLEAYKCVSREVIVDKATGIIIAFKGDVSLAEVDSAVKGFAEKCDGQPMIIYGAKYDETILDSCTVTVIAAEYEEGYPIYCFKVILNDAITNTGDCEDNLYYSTANGLNIAYKVEMVFE